MVTENSKFDEETHNALYERALKLQRASMSGDRHIPMPQRTLLKGQATALYDQWLELEAAQFNKTTDDYNKAIDSVKNALDELNKELGKLDDVIKVVKYSTKVFAAINKLLQVAL